MNSGNNVHFGSQDYLLQHGSPQGDSGTITPSGHHTMSGRPRKNVKWDFGDSEDHSPLDTPSLAPQHWRHSSDLPFPLSPSHTPLDQHDHPNEEAELRDILSKTLPQQSTLPARLPQQNSGADAPQGQRLPLAKPKSVLRSGTSTPVVTVSPPPEPQVVIPHLEDKTRSAKRAKREADRLSQNLANEHTHQPTKRRSFWKAKGNRRAGSASPDEWHPRLFRDADTPLDSGQVTPHDVDGADYVPRPRRFRLAGLSAKNVFDEFMAPSRRGSADSELSSAEGLVVPEGPAAGHRRSFSSLSSLVGPASNQFTAFAGATLGDKIKRPGLPRARSEDGSYAYSSQARRSSSSKSLSEYVQKMAITGKRKKSKETKNAITKHVVETEVRKSYMVKFCRALIKYGAPTHRLERYMQATSNMFQIDGHFIYLPGCMICSFDDVHSHTTDVRIVRASEGVDLGKLKDVHDIYKNVVQDRMSAEEAMNKLSTINNKAKKFSTWQLVVLHGVASAAVAPFAFHGRLIDLPVAFFLGLLLGFLRLYVAVKSELYASIFEVTSVIITSLLSRLFGSLNGGNLFCFSALAQSSIALILPGYIVLCGASELQNRSLVAGSVRLVYSIIYSLFIGFGLTIGSAFYGWADKNASSESTCRDPMSGYWPFFFVPVFALCLMIINQAKWKQMPIMMFIALVGYAVSYASAKGLPNNAQISSALAAIAISVIANTYSRIGFRLDEPVEKLVHKVRKAVTSNAEPQDDEEQQQQKKATQGEQVNQRDHQRIPSPTPIASNASDITLSDLSGSVTPLHSPRSGSPEDHGEHEDPDDKSQVRANYALAASAMLPAIFVLVPSGLSVSGSLVQGIDNANSITHNSTAADMSGIASNTAFNVGLNVVQVAIGITVGLFVGAIFVYPFGKGGKWGSKKMRSGLFTF